MITAVDDLLPILVPKVERALVDWLPQQRWFGGKNRTIARVELVRTVEFVDRLGDGGPLGLLVVAAVDYAEHCPGMPGTDYYHIPLGARRTLREAGPEQVIRYDGVSVYDSTVDGELNAELLRLIAACEVRGDVRFRTDRDIDLSAATRNRRHSGEQSNTSIVFANEFILKLFRRVAAGVNPDLELPHLLHRSGNQYVAPVLGAVEAEMNRLPMTLGVLQSFVADATDGWTLANRELAGLLRSSPQDLPKADARIDRATHRLGRAVAEVHTDLGAELGAATATGTDVARLSERMVARLDSALSAVPALVPYGDDLRSVFTGVASLPDGGHLQRVHGDLHLGQVLWSGGRWLLIDFEGEPAVPLAERVAWQSPLRDVAGMLRSFDYAAQRQAHEHFRRTGGDPVEIHATAQWWSARMARSFLRGYAELARVGVRGRDELLTAFELDKAVYEVVYEAQNRPEWGEVPLRGVHQLLHTRRRAQ